MIGRSVSRLFLLLILLSLFAGAAALVTGARRSPPSAETAVAAARRHARRTSTAAVASAAVVTATLALTGAPAGRDGLGALLLPIVLGVVHTAVLALGELTWPRPVGQTRRARLGRRGLLDAAPRWLVRTTAGAVVAAAATVGLGAWLAGPDGRSFAGGTADGQVRFAAGPYYGRPAAIGVLVLLAAVLVALWIVADRPAVATQDDRIEAALRRASAHRVLRGAAGAVLFLTGGLVAVSGLAASHAAVGARDTASANGLAVDTAVAALPTLGTVIAALGLLLALGGLILLAVRVPADWPSAPAPAAG